MFSAMAFDILDDVARASADEAVWKGPTVGDIGGVGEAGEDQGRWPRGITVLCLLLSQPDKVESDVASLVWTRWLK